MIPTVKNVRDNFKGALKGEDFTIDKTGAKTIEWIGASFVADEPAIFGEPNKEYIELELQWYKDQSTNINDIYGENREPPAAWQYAADKYGNINSNYGKLIYSNQYHNQYKNVLEELKQYPDGRRAEMVYNRPSIWNEYDSNGMSDFICTNAVTYYVRDNVLHCVVQMRSNDVVFGYKNDYAWQKFVLDQLAFDLNIKPGLIYWQVQNLHVYERHFNLVK